MVNNKLTSSAPALTTLPLTAALFAGLLLGLLLITISPKTVADPAPITEEDKLSNPLKTPAPNLSLKVMQRVAVQSTQN